MTEQVHNITTLPKSRFNKKTVLVAAAAATAVLAGLALRSKLNGTEETVAVNPEA